MSLKITRVEGLALLQDRGRLGQASSGLSPSGAFDRAAHDRANRLLGNTTDAASIEVIGGLTITFERNAVVAVTGAVGPVFVDKDPLHHEWPTLVRTGQTVRIAPATAGLRSYIAAQGGIVATPVLGSRSYDTLAHIGPPPLTPGDTLDIGTEHDGAIGGEPESRLTDGVIQVDASLGPRDNWFTQQAHHRLFNSHWTVGTDSNRVGVRLSGPELHRERHEELPSEPCVRGSIQVAADGQPIVFGPDHPVTGGYPVIAVLTRESVDLIGQARPGDTVRISRAMSRAS